MGWLTRNALDTDEVSRRNPAIVHAEALAAGAKRALDALPLTEREVLMLWDGGLSYGEIAERTSHSMDTVGVILSRARKNLTASYDQMVA